MEKSAARDEKEAPRRRLRSAIALGAAAALVAASAPALGALEPAQAASGQAQAAEASSASGATSETLEDHRYRTICNYWVDSAHFYGHVSYKPDCIIKKTIDLVSGGYSSDETQRSIVSSIFDEGRAVPELSHVWLFYDKGGAYHEMLLGSDKWSMDTDKGTLTLSDSVLDIVSSVAKRYDTAVELKVDVAEVVTPEMAFAQYKSLDDFFTAEDIQNEFASRFGNKVEEWVSETYSVDPSIFSSGDSFIDDTDDIGEDGLAGLAGAPAGTGLVVSRTATAAKAKKAAGSSRSLVLAPSVKKLSKGFLKGTKVTALYVTSHKLTKKSVRKCLKGSKVKTVKVCVSTESSVNRRWAKKYKKIFAKKNSGKKVTVKYGRHDKSGNVKYRKA